MKNLSLALAALVLGTFSFLSCTLAAGTGNAATALSTSDMSELQKSYMTSYYADSSGSPGGASSIRALTPFSVASSSASKATVPVEQYTSLAFSSTPQSISNYPEPGETTSFTATSYDATNNVYDVQVTTSYPSTDTRASYLEEYYVRDATADGIWTTADPVVSYSSSWVATPAARVKMQLTYRDGSIRNEVIYGIPAAGSRYDYSSLALSGSMDLVNISAAPATSSDANVKYSSLVVYTYQPARDSSTFWFWKGKQNAGVIGVRYYTEAVDGSKYVGRSASYERIIGSISSYPISAPAAIVTAVYSPPNNVLGSSVVRQEVQYVLNSAGSGASGSAVSSQTKMQTRIMDFVNSWDYVLIQDASSTVVLGQTLPW